MMKALLRGLLLFLILFFALLTFLLTPTGLRLSIETSGYFLPGKLSVKKISGVIIGPLTVEQFHYQDARQTIDIKKLYLNWRPLDLFKKQLHVHSLDVQGLHIITNNSNLPREWTIESLQQTAKALLASLQRRTLPFHGVIEHARFSDIQITNEIEKTKTEIPKLHLRAVITATVWDANVAASIKKPLPVELRFILQGSPTNHAMHFTLIGHHTHWELTGIGDAESLTIHTLKKLLLGGTYDMEFYIHWENALTWDGKIIANHMDLSLLNALWEKSLSITLNSTGTDHHLSLDELTTENNATITTSNGSVHLTVQRKNKWHIQWNGHIQQIESHGKIEGDLLNPYFEAELHGQSQEGKKISSAKLALLGNFTHHTLSAQFIAPQQKINIKVIGAFNNKTGWSGDLQEFTVLMTRSIIWRLEKPVALTSKSNNFSVAPLCLQSPRAGSVCLQAQLLNKKLTGSAQINVTRFDWLQSWFHHVSIPSGVLHGNFQMNGTLDHPHITGTLNLNKGSIIFPRLNIALDNITAAITSADDILKFTVQATSQKKPVTLQGSIDLSQPDFLAQAQLTTQQTTIINTEEYSATATSNLQAKIKNKDIFITGNITIPAAYIHPNDFEQTTTLPVHDIVYVGSTTTPVAPFWKIHTDITVNIGDNARITVAGADAELGGTLRVTQQPNQEVFATGNVFVRKGTFSVYGQTLTITPDSSFTYANNLLNNPTLDVKATKIISDVNNMGISNFSREKLMVGVEVTGNVRTPKITFFSNRSHLSQADILSYILLGYSNDSNTPGNTDFLLRALSAVKLSSQGILGKQNIASQIQSGLGLSELGVESDTTIDSLGNPLVKQSFFVVGKSLTKRLYMRVSFGMLNPVNVYQLGYLLDHHWSVETDSSSLGNGADVLYTFSRN